MSILSALEEQPADALLALIGLHASDLRLEKIDLGVGVYRNEAGNTPVFAAVKEAEAKLVSEQTTKSYLGAEGDVRFLELLAPIVFGRRLAASDQLTGVQTPGGTGALRLGAEIIARAEPWSRVWIGTPTWPNHVPIFRESGLNVEMHRYYDPRTSHVDFDAMMTDLAHAARGDVVLLHGCCHNPTGTGFTSAEWQALTELFVDRGLVPFIDLAYQGLGQGIDEDAAGVRHMLANVEEGMLAYSCDKNFGLYRERVGALWVKASKRSEVKAVRDTMLVLARSLWSMPPDHGAATVRVILDDRRLEMLWRDELDVMRCRIAALRTGLARRLPALAAIGEQHGLFAMLPVNRETVLSVRESHGVYMAESGRINIAGLTGKNLHAFADAIKDHL